MIDQLEAWELSPETFCLAPYITTDLDQDGSVIPCYRGKSTVGNWKTQPFNESFNGAAMQQLRLDLFNGVKNKNCASCYMAESNGGISPRMNFFFDWKEEYVYSEYLPDNLIDIIKQDPAVGDLNNIVRTEIRPSSLCNQRCMHCGPNSSTKWIETYTKEENFKLYGYHDGFGPINHPTLTSKNIAAYYKDTLTSDGAYTEDIKDLLDASPLATFTGGEPLLTPEHKEWLNYFITTGSARTKIVEYNTNLNIKNLESYFPLWEMFKSVNFRVSVDASFDTYEYFRTYGNKQRLTENLKKLTEFQDRCRDQGLARIKISASITFNMFSALRWKEITKDWADYGLRLHASLIMDHPVSVKYLPRSLCEQALEEMQWCLDHIHEFYDDEYYIHPYILHTENCMNYIRGFDNKFDRFDENIVKYIEFCDKSSGNNYYDYYPELKEYMYGDDNTRI